MAGSKWKQIMERLIEGAESELRSSASAKTRAAVNLYYAPPQNAT
jgi:hypothetical protein